MPGRATSTILDHATVHEIGPGPRAAAWEGASRCSAVVIGPELKHVLPAFPGPTHLRGSIDACIEVLQGSSSGDFVVIDAHHGAERVHTHVADRGAGAVQADHGMMLWDGELTAGHLEGVEVSCGVVLAGCRAIGRVSPYAEQWVGLAPALLRRGAAWVVATHWPVVDEPPTIDFLQALVAAIERHGPAAGLRAAQLAARGRDPGTGWGWLSWMPWFVAHG